MRVLFMGTPDFALESLKSLFKNNYEIIGVVTNPDKPKGRGMKMVMSPVKMFAIENDIQVYQPKRVKNNVEFIDTIKSLKPDVICVVAYGKILPSEILEIPKFGCINVHGSILPQYRGAAPIQWAILNGDKKTGVTTMYMDVGMDSGDIILTKETNIGSEETTGELWDRLSVMGGELLVETLKLIEEGKATRTKQKENFTLAPMLNKDMAKINFQEQTAEQIHNLVRGLNPIMGAYSFLNEKKIKFWKVRIVSKEELINIFPELGEYFEKVNKLTHGTILFSDEKKGLFIKVKDGIIEVKEIQGENAKRMDAKDFLRGNKIDIGQNFK